MPLDLKIILYGLVGFIAGVLAAIPILLKIPKWINNYLDKHK